VAHFVFVSVQGILFKTAHGFYVLWFGQLVAVAQSLPTHSALPALPEQLCALLLATLRFFLTTIYKNCYSAALLVRLYIVPKRLMSAYDSCNASGSVNFLSPQYCEVHPGS